MAQFNLVTSDELASALKALDKKQESRLYTVKGDIMLKLDTLGERLDGIENRMTGIEKCLSTIAANGHRG